MTHTLGVFDGLARVGKVEFEPMTETFSFHYEEAWKTSPQAYPLSPVFPLNATPDGFGSIRRFIENLLPEGRVLDIVAASQHIAKNNTSPRTTSLGSSGKSARKPRGPCPSCRKTRSPPGTTPRSERSRTMNFDSASPNAKPSRSLPGTAGSGCPSRATRTSWPSTCRTTNCFSQTTATPLPIF